jgi:adenine-specific DNA-methyltransferase
VDIIYIDPPYNTGNSFVYNDTMVEKSDKYPHSAWLSFMNERLIAARTLMKTTGVIFISIGIEEQAHLKLLCDQIFGEKNFITTISRVTKKSSNVGKHFVSSVDYVLVYSKTRNGARMFAAPSLNTEYDKKFKHQDETGPYVPQALYMTTLGVSKNNRYWVECPDGTLCIPPGVTFPKNPANGEQVESVTPNDKGWRYTKERYLKEPANNYIFKQTTTSPLVTPDGTRSAWNVYTKQYRGTGMVRPRNFIDAYPNRTGTAELKALGVHFDYPKPVNFIKHLLTLTQTPKNAVILDFFAGSGTTGHAVMLMNTEDDGARQCIMVTNNENNIYHTVTIPRLKAALSGKWGDGKPRPPLRGALETFKITTRNN